MTTARILVLMAIAAAGSVGAQEPPRSPYDTNPKCSQRDVATDDPDCVIPQEGTPRRTYPPPGGPGSGQPPPPPEKPANPPAQQKDFKSSGSPGKSR